MSRFEAVIEAANKARNIQAGQFYAERERRRQYLQQIAAEHDARIEQMRGRRGRKSAPG